MAWKATGRPSVRQQRGRWVVRVDGIDTITGRRRPRQLGTFTSQRAARTAAAVATEKGVNSGGSRTLGDLVDRWIESRSDVGPNQRQQYRWAAGHIRAGIGAIVLDRLDREDIARWLNHVANAGQLSRRSIQILRMTLRAALSAAVDDGELRRSPAENVPMPRSVTRPPRQREIDAWDDEQLDQFLAAARDHRWGGAVRLEALYGLRRSELLALRWRDVDLDAGIVRVQAGLTEAGGQLSWSDGKNPRSRRTIPIDVETGRALLRQRHVQRREALAAADAWQDHDLVVATQLGKPVRPRNYNHTLDRIVAAAGVPRLTSHGLRHTAATHMVATSADLGEVRAAAELLGHSPEMLMKTYSHALPASIRAVAGKVGERSARTAGRDRRSGRGPGSPV